MTDEPRVFEEAEAATPSPTLRSRHDQMFPELTPQEIERLRRFGSVRRYRDGEPLFKTGDLGRGMFVVISGHVTITQRDGLGHITPIVDQGPGQFLAEVGPLSGRPALVDGHAEGDVEALVIAPEALRRLLIAEAELGERIVRALILRRVGLIETGASGPVLIGSPASHDVVRLQNFLRRNGQPHHVLDPEIDPEACDAGRRRYGAGGARAAAGGHARTARCCATRRSPSSPARSAWSRRRDGTQALRRRRRRRGPGRARDRGLCRLRRACRWSCSMPAPTAARPAPARGSRTISASRPAFPARRWPAARSCRRRNSAPR